MIEAHHFDAMVMLPGCDKIVPGMIMAAARVDIPTVIIPGGPMLNGSYKDKEIITLTDMREFIGQTQTGKMSEEDLLNIETVSYTHLDVYKRQNLNDSAIIIFYFREI